MSNIINQINKEIDNYKKIKADNKKLKEDLDQSLRGVHQEADLYAFADHFVNKIHIMDMLLNVSNREQAETFKNNNSFNESISYRDTIVTVKLSHSLGFTKTVPEWIRITNEKERITLYVESLELKKDHENFNKDGTISNKIKKLYSNLSEKDLTSLTSKELLFILNFFKNGKKNLEITWGEENPVPYAPNLLGEGVYSSILINKASRRIALIALTVAIGSMLLSHYDKIIKLFNLIINCMGH